MPPMTQNLPRRGGPADRRQAQVLTLTALNLRRRRGITASVLADCPVQPATPFSSAAPHTALTPDAGRRTRAWSGVKMPKAAFLRSRCEFQDRYYETADFASIADPELSRPGAVGRPWRSTRFILQSTSSDIPTSRSVRWKRRPKWSGVMPAIISIAARRTCCAKSRVPRRSNRPRPPARRFAPGPRPKACCWSRRKTANARHENCWPRYRAQSSLALENRGDRLDLIARINRQSGADRVAAVERALAGKHLRGHQVPQHRHLHEFFFLRQHIALDGQGDEDRDNGLLRVGGMRLKDREQFAELHHLVHVEDTLLERPRGRRVDAGQGRKAHLGHLCGRPQR